MRNVDLSTPDTVMTEPSARDVVLFDPPPLQRSLRAGDLVRLLVGIAFVGVGLLLGTFATSTIDGVEDDVVEAIGQIPSRLEQTVIGSAQLIATFVPLIAVGVVVWYRKWRTLLSLWIASTAAGLVTGLVLSRVGERDVSNVIRARALEESPLVAADFPTTNYLAGAAAAATVGAAYLPRRWKRATWWWIALLVVLRFLGPGQPPLDVWIGVSIGVVVGSLTLLVIGSPNLEPSPESLLAGLRDAGLDPAKVERLEYDDNQPNYATVERDGRRTFVKLRTPDDRSWDMLSRIGRAIRLRSSEFSRPFGTLKRRVEHEALAARTVLDGGTRSPHVIALGVTDGGAVFVVEDHIVGRQLSDLGANEFDDDLARQVFEQVRAVHHTRTAHHNLTLDNLLVDEEGHLWLVDFDDAELAASHRARARDVAEVLVAVALVIGPDRTVAIGTDVLGDEIVAASLPLLQPLALSRTLGKSIRSQRDLLDHLRTEIHDRTGADDVPLEKLARVRTRTLVMLMAGALAFYSLLPQFGNLGDTVDAFGGARLGWMAPLVAVSLAYFVFATISFLGSVAQPMPVAASARSQVANSFAQLVGPASAGKMALAGRFLQRSGLTSAEASASVALNTIAGIGTHLLLMLGFFAWAGGASVGGVPLPSLVTTLIVVGGVAVLIVLASVIRPIRRALINPVVDGLRTAAGYVAQVVRSPVRVLALLGGSTFITLTYLFALVFSVEAFGGDLTVAQIGAAYLGAAAIANIAPTPGGLGALEAAMIAALSGFGLEGGIAISSVLTFRLATFWIPILPGWLTFLWMERRGEI